MSDGSMMAALHKYKKQSFWEEHKTITLNTLTEYREYEIVAVFRTSVSVTTGFLYNLFVDASEPEEFDAYVQKCKSIAYYDTGVEVEYGDKLITLSTCDRSITNGRLVVVAKLITDEAVEEVTE
jgi:sortase B